MGQVDVSIYKRASAHPSEGTVIFVHGITGNSQSTYTNSDANFDWMAEIAAELPEWNVLAADYGSSFWINIKGLLAVDEGPTIQTLALELAHELAEKQIRTNRVVFVCHSMGGLVVKHLFDPAHQDLIGTLLDRVTGIQFLGTPHAGADLARRLEKYSQKLSSRLVSDLCNTTYLAELDRGFADQCINRSIAVVNFIEQVPLLYRLRVVQTQESALDWISRSRNIEVTQDHREISKPEGTKALQHRELRRLIKRTHDSSSNWINVFTHFLDHHFLRTAGYDNGFKKKRIQILAEQAFRLSLLVSDNLFIHAGFYYESELARNLVNKYEPYFMGKITLFANAENMELYTISSQNRFMEGDSHHRAYRFEPEFSKFDFIPTAESSTGVIRRAWLATDPETLLANEEIAREATDRDRFIEEWANVPERLGNLAMIAKYIAPILVGMPAPLLNRRIQQFTGSSYYDGVLRKLNCRILVKIPYLPQIVPDPDSRHRVDFRHIMKLDRATERVVVNTKEGSLGELISYGESEQGRDFYEHSRAVILDGS